MDKRQVAIEKWVEEYPFLDEVAKLQQLTLKIMGNYSEGKQDLAGMIKDPREIEENFQKKQPVLQKNLLSEDFYKENGRILENLVATFAESDLPETFKRQSVTLERFLKTRPSAAAELIKATLGEQHEFLPELEETQMEWGMANYLVWSVLAETLEPLRIYLDGLQAEQVWNEPHCPLCGQLPAMAQLIRTEKGRERELSCSLCHTKWKYKRIGCPYCGNEDQENLNIIELTETPEFRIDTCNQCKGYLKTYLDEGNEEITLSDWSTLHLDAIGKQKGFQRKDYQLYKI